MPWLIERLQDRLGGHTVRASGRSLCIDPQKAAGVSMCLQVDGSGFALSFNGVQLEVESAEQVLTLLRDGLDGKLRTCHWSGGGRGGERLERVDSKGVWAVIAGHEHRGWRAGAPGGEVYRCNGSLIRLAVG